METIRVAVNKDSTVIYKENGHNAHRHPILISMDMKANKGDPFSVNQIKISPEDKGDGIIHADGGKTYYYANGEAGFYFSVDDVTKI